MIFFTSDTHFGHHNIIKYCGRPFKDANDMNESFIRNWNSVVGVDDDVYHLGDVSFMSKQQTINIIKKLNGRIYLVSGNHDRNYRKE
jgi:calcineurin-like phosphoesterase family protein